MRQLWVEQWPSLTWLSRPPPLLLTQIFNGRVYCILRTETSPIRTACSRVLIRQPHRMCSIQNSLQWQKIATNVIDPSWLQPIAGIPVLLYTETVYDDSYLFSRFCICPWFSSPGFLDCIGIHRIMCHLRFRPWRPFTPGALVELLWSIVEIHFMIFIVCWWCFL